MAEVKDQVREDNNAFRTEAAPAAQAGAPEKKTLGKKQRRKRIRTIAVIVVLLAAAFAAWKLLGGKNGGSRDIGMETVQYGSITAQVEGTGTVKARNSETLLLTTAGTVLDVMVSEGDLVTAGQPLFTIDSPAAKTAV